MNAPDDYRIEAVSVDEASLSAYALLLSQTFSETSFFTPEYLRWQYANNPSGTIVGFDARTADGAVAAHYVCQPFTASIDGSPRRGLLSLNTATHPEHQGRRLFTTLATRTYEAAQAAGYDFVVGVANANSTPGFVGKLGFQLVAPLDAWIGIGSLRWNTAAPAPRYQRTWTNGELEWRLNSPRNRYTLKRGRVYAPTGIPLTDALIGFFPGVADTKATIAPAHLWLGLDPAVSATRTSVYVPIPRRLRPSPLNLIYKPLGDVPPMLHANDVRFWAIDFDAY